MSEKLIEVGKLGKTHGFKGHLKADIFEEDILNLEEIQVFFIQTVPFFIEELKDSGANFIIKFEDIDTKEKASEIAGKPLFVKEEDAILATSTKGMATDESTPFEFIDFEIIDLEIGPVGIVNDVFELPEQIIAQVDYNEKEVLIPINDTFVKEIDFDSKQLLMDLPSGLLDL